MTALREGDVVEYDPPERTGLLAGTDRRWCIEGMAIARFGRDGALQLVDTYWDGGEDKVVPRHVDYEVLFNLGEYEQLSRHERYRWERYAPADRAAVTHQHRLQRDLYVRKGATEDRGTIIANAQQALVEAEEKLDSARRQRDQAQDYLDRLIEGGEPR